MESGVRPCKRLRVTEDEFGNYGVFLSHRGPDTKTGFVGFLYEGLEAAGLHPFLDCKSIPKGHDSWTDIEHAIKTTPIAVIIFSESFAQSDWCLRELHEILDTPGMKVVPVFYRVQPCELSFPEKGQLAAGFEKLKRTHVGALIEQWREDLRRVSKLNGWEHKVGDRRLETDLVKEVVGKVVELANKPLPLDVGDYVIGVDQVAEKIIRKLDETKGVVMLGLWGMGGIGKSTLARELYNRLSRRFAASCYVEDVTEKVIQGGVVKVQNCILKELCTNESEKVKDKSKGKRILEERLFKKRILLVLDDVGDNDEMEYWVTRRMLLTEGSMCIVTSRDRRVFEMPKSFDMKHEVHIHDVQGLSSADSERVFGSFLFGGYWKVKQGFEELVANISEACAGVPLVLKVFGGLLKNEEDVEIWKDVLKKLIGGTIMDEEKIFACLRISYDSLQVQYREMFLDIACGLVGQSKDLAMRVWKSDGWSAALGVRSLVERALVTVDDDGCFHMHDHLRDMGREIVRKQRTSDGVIRRLWMPESLTLLEGNEQLPESLQTLIIYGSDHYYQRPGTDLDVSHMKDLRILICGYSINVRFPLPKNLRWCSTEALRDGVVGTFPIVLGSNKLIILDLEQSGIETLCESFGNLSNLEVLNLGSTRNLSWLPKSFGCLKNLQDLNLRYSGIQSLPESFGELSNLEVLNLGSTWNLSGLPKSFGGLKNLQDLNLGYSEIQSLPESFGELSNLKVLNLGFTVIRSGLPKSFGGLKNLQDLNLGYSKIQSLPESFGELSNLKVLNLGFTMILSGLPKSFGGLKNLQDLNLGYSEIQSLPESFGELSNLKVLNLGFTMILSWLPKSFGGLKNLQDLNLGYSKIQSLPESFGELSNLKVLNLGFTMILSWLPKSFGGLKNLQDLNLGYSKIQSLPDSFGELSNLEVLDLNCSLELISLPHSFGNLKKLRDLYLTASAMQSLPDSFGELSNLEVLKLNECRELISLPHSFGNLKKLRDLKLQCCGFQRLPESFEELSNLEVPNLNECRELISLPHSFVNLKKLRDLDLSQSTMQSLPESFGELSNLEVLDLNDCRKLISLPDSFGNLKKLRDLMLRGCGIRSLPESFGELSNLEVLDLNWCCELITLPHSFGNLKKLRDLKRAEFGIKSLPESFGELSHLKC